MLSIKEYDAIKEGRYRELKEAFDKLLAVYEGVPSVKGFDKVIRDTKKGSRLWRSVRHSPKTMKKLSRQR